MINELYSFIQNQESKILIFDEVYLKLKENLEKENDINSFIKELTPNFNHLNAEMKKKIKILIQQNKEVFLKKEIIKEGFESQEVLYFVIKTLGDNYISKFLKRQFSKKNNSDFNMRENFRYIIKEESKNYDSSSTYTFLESICDLYTFKTDSQIEINEYIYNNKVLLDKLKKYIYAGEKINQLLKYNISFEKIKKIKVGFTIYYFLLSLNKEELNNVLKEELILTDMMSAVNTEDNFEISDSNEYNLIREILVDKIKNDESFQNIFIKIFQNITNKKKQNKIYECMFLEKDFLNKNTYKRVFQLKNDYEYINFIINNIDKINTSIISINDKKEILNYYLDNQKDKEKIDFKDFIYKLIENDEEQEIKEIVSGVSTQIYIDINKYQDNYSKMIDKYKFLIKYIYDFDSINKEIKDKVYKNIINVDIGFNLIYSINQKVKNKTEKNMFITKSGYLNFDFTKDFGENFIKIISDKEIYKLFRISKQDFKTFKLSKFTEKISKEEFEETTEEYYSLNSDNIHRFLLYIFYNNKENMLKFKEMFEYFINFNKSLYNLDDNNKYMKFDTLFNIEEIKKMNLEDISFLLSIKNIKSSFLKKEFLLTILKKIELSDKEDRLKIYKLINQSNIIEFKEIKKEIDKKEQNNYSRSNRRNFYTPEYNRNKIFNIFEDKNEIEAIYKTIMKEYELTLFETKIKEEIIINDMNSFLIEYENLFNFNFTKEEKIEKAIKVFEYALNNIEQINNNSILQTLLYSKCKYTRAYTNILKIFEVIEEKDILINKKLINSSEISKIEVEYMKYLFEGQKNKITLKDIFNFNISNEKNKEVITNFLIKNINKNIYLYDIEKEKVLQLLSFFINNKDELIISQYNSDIFVNLLQHLIKNNHTFSEKIKNKLIDIKTALIKNNKMGDSHSKLIVYINKILNNKTNIQTSTMSKEEIVNTSDCFEEYYNIINQNSIDIYEEKFNYKDLLNMINNNDLLLEDEKKHIYKNVLENVSKIDKLKISSDLKISIGMTKIDNIYVLVGCHVYIEKKDNEEYFNLLKTISNDENCDMVMYMSFNNSKLNSKIRKKYLDNFYNNILNKNKNTIIQYKILNNKNLKLTNLKFQEYNKKKLKEQKEYNLRPLYSEQQHFIKQKYNDDVNIEKNNHFNIVDKYYLNLNIVDIVEDLDKVGVEVANDNSEQDQLLIDYNYYILTKNKKLIISESEYKIFKKIFFSDQEVITFNSKFVKGHLSILSGSELDLDKINIEILFDIVKNVFKSDNFFIRKYKETVSILCSDILYYLKEKHLDKTLKYIKENDLILDYLDNLRLNLRDTEETKKVFNFAKENNIKIQTNTFQTEIFNEDTLTINEKKDFLETLLLNLDYIENIEQKPFFVTLLKKLNIVDIEFSDKVKKQILDQNTKINISDKNFLINLILKQEIKEKQELSKLNFDLKAQIKIESEIIEEMMSSYDFSGLIESIKEEEIVIIKENYTLHSFEVLEKKIKNPFFEKIVLFEDETKKYLEKIIFTDEKEKYIESINIKSEDLNFVENINIVENELTRLINLKEKVIKELIKVSKKNNDELINKCKKEIDILDTEIEKNIELKKEFEIKYQNIKQNKNQTFKNLYKDVNLNIYLFSKCLKEDLLLNYNNDDLFQIILGNKKIPNELFDRELFEKLILLKEQNNFEEIIEITKNIKNEFFNISISNMNKYRKKIKLVDKNEYDLKYQIMLEKNNCNDILDEDLLDSLIDLKMNNNNFYEKISIKDYMIKYSKIIKRLNTTMENLDYNLIEIIHNIALYSSIQNIDTLFNLLNNLNIELYDLFHFVNIQSFKDNILKFGEDEIYNVLFSLLRKETFVKNFEENKLNSYSYIVLTLNNFSSLISDLKEAKTIDINLIKNLLSIRNFNIDNFKLEQSLKHCLISSSENENGVKDISEEELVALNKLKEKTEELEEKIISKEEILNNDIPNVKFYKETNNQILVGEFINPIDMRSLVHGKASQCCLNPLGAARNILTYQIENFNKTGTFIVTMFDKRKFSSSYINNLKKEIDNFNELLFKKSDIIDKELLELNNKIKDMIEKDNKSKMIADCAVWKKNNQLTIDNIETNNNIYSTNEKGEVIVTKAVDSDIIEMVNLFSKNIYDFEKRRFITQILNNKEEFIKNPNNYLREVLKSKKLILNLTVGSGHSDISDLDKYYIKLNNNQYEEMINEDYYTDASNQYFINSFLNDTKINSEQKILDYYDKKTIKDLEKELISLQKITEKPIISDIKNK